MKLSSHLHIFASFRFLIFTFRLHILTLSRHHMFTSAHVSPGFFFHVLFVSCLFRRGAVSTKIHDTQPFCAKISLDQPKQWDNREILLYTDTFTNKQAYAHQRSHFYFTFDWSSLISCEALAADTRQINFT